MAVEFDVFLSYAHAGNKDGWVDGLRDFLVAEHQRFAVDELRVFMA